MKCSSCGTEQPTRNDDVLPRGWKRMGGSVLCRKCKKADLLTAVLSLPVWGFEGITADQFYDAFRQMTHEARLVANVAMREMLKADSLPVPKDDGKLSMPRLEADGKPIYRLASEVAPSFDSNSLASLLQRLRGAYSKYRLAIGAGWRSNAEFERRIAVPVKGSAWTAGYDGQGRPTASIRLGRKDAPGIRSQRITIRLAHDGREFGRQLGDWKRIVDGTAIKGEMMLCPITRRGGIVGAMARVCITKPRPPRRVGGVMEVDVGGGMLLRWKIRTPNRAGGENIRELAPIESDEAMRILNGRAAQRRRMMNDLKSERRGSDRRAKMMLALGDKSKRWANRLDTLLGQTTAAVIGAANRAGVGKIQFTVATNEIEADDPRDIAAFPWCSLRDRIRNKCAAEGIEFVELTPGPRVSDKKRLQAMAGLANAVNQLAGEVQR